LNHFDTIAEFDRHTDRDTRTPWR